MTIERSADDLDMAAQRQEEFNEQALADVRAASGRQSHPDFDGEHCLECEVDMPIERIDAGRIRCTACETAREKSNKLRGK